MSDTEKVDIVVSTPYLQKAGMKINFEEVISAEKFDDQVRLEEEIVFTNGIMAELKNNLKCFNVY